MINLAINVDHVATLRQARGGIEPDPVTAAGICELAGAGGIVVHLREDRRHIQDRDVRLLRQLVKTKLNLEMGAAEEIIKIALDVKPDMITLVPEKRQELTTEGGLDVAGQKAKLKKVVARMEKAGIPVSMFIDPDPRAGGGGPRGGRHLRGDPHRPLRRRDERGRGRPGVRTGRRRRRERPMRPTCGSTPATA